MNENNNVLEQDILDQTDDALTENDATENETVTNNETNEKDELGEMKDKYLRLLAEFDNFKRRSSKERIELIGTASREAIVALLPIMDDFERAEKNEGLEEGIALIYTKLQNTLHQKGLKAMESNGEVFNPEHHEAITEVPMGEEMKGKVIDTVEKGYFLNDKIIRYAKVVVGA